MDEIKQNWRDIATHDDEKICGFFGQYAFLSNFYCCPIWLNGLVYPSSENAYMAAKVIPTQRQAFVDFTPREAKTKWKEFTLLDKDAQSWDARKYKAMFDILWVKFSQNGDLREKLLATGDKYLEETNWWKDSIWGVDINNGGANALGKTLMKIRSDLKSQDEFIASL